MERGEGERVTINQSKTKFNTLNTVEPHLSGPQLSDCSDYLTIELMIFMWCIK